MTNEEALRRVDEKGTTLDAVIIKKANWLSHIIRLLSDAIEGIKILERRK